MTMLDAFPFLPTCALFKACIVELVRKSIGDGLKMAMLSIDDHDHKIRATKQRTGIGNYSFVYRTIKLWTQLHAQALAIFRVNRIFLERELGKYLYVRGSEGFLKRGGETSKSAGN
jgi:hypothetical protein